MEYEDSRWTGTGLVYFFAERLFYVAYVVLEEGV